MLSRLESIFCRRKKKESMKKPIESFTFKRLGKEYLPQLMDLQNEVFATLPDESLLRKNTVETFQPCFLPPSVVLGAFYDGVLVGVGILLYPDEEEDLSLQAVDLPENAVCANLKLTLVKPSFFGNGLQINLLNRLEDFAKEMGTDFLCATVSPLNVYSLTNLSAVGYQKNTTVKKYGGLERLLMVKKL